MLRLSCADINLHEKTVLVKGSPLQPPLAKLLQFSDDTHNFASQICAQIESAINIISLQKLDISSLEGSFRIPLDWQPRILEIIAYTSFISENEI